MDGMQTPRRRRTPSAARVAAMTGWLALVALSGCSVGDPRTVDPSGVDGLVIPTPAPDPADFVADVDNPWLPLEAGSRWRYRVTTGGEVVERVTVAVTDRAKEVAGVPVTVVREVVREAARGDDGEVVEETLAWFAQDADGNVWHFGSRGSWEAGVGGAQAGLAMPATPRIGDGFEREHAEGVAQDRARVLALDSETVVPAGVFSDLVATEDTTPLEPGRVERTFYAKGVGMVRQETVSGGTEVVELVAHTTSATP